MLTIKLTGFNYELKLSEDGKFGSVDAAGKWNGMIGEVIDGRTHIAAAAITITAERYLINCNLFFAGRSFY